MKALWIAISIFLLLHAVALLAGVAWLYTSDRLSRDRLATVKSVFAITLEQEENQAEQAKVERAAEGEKEQREQWLQSVKDGPQSVADRLTAEERAQELAYQRQQRLDTDRRALLAGMATYQSRIESLLKQLRDQKQQLEQQQEQKAKALEAEGFKQAVKMYERVKPNQAKRMFLDLINQGQIDQVVTYLSTMRPRSSAAVLKQFKADEEIAVATQLVEGLRSRGLETLDQIAPPKGTAQ